jgi:cell division protein FtsI/penicillin-binding protein 2
VAGPLDYSQAVALSCNWYFTTIALRLPPRDLQAALREFEARLAVSNLDRQLQSIGLWGVSTTPLRLARAYRGLMLREPSRVSNGGKTGTTAEAAWYAGWAPVERPRIVLAAMTGGRGVFDARPAAEELIRKWLR